MFLENSENTEANPSDVKVETTQTLKTIKFKHHMYDAETESIAATSELFGIHMDREIRKGTPFPAFVK